MATQRNNAQEPSEIVGAISKFAGAAVGTATAIGKKIAGGVRGVATGREKVLSKRVAALESDLAVMRRELKKVRGAEKDKKPKKKTGPKQAKIKKVKRKTKAGKDSSRPRNYPTSGAGGKRKVATQGRQPGQPAPKAEMSDDKSSKMTGPTDSES